jgi:hypothetical protein
MLLQNDSHADAPLSFEGSPPCPFLVSWFRIAARIVPFPCLHQSATATVTKMRRPHPLFLFLFLELRVEAGEARRRLGQLRLHRDLGVLYVRATASLGRSSPDVTESTPSTRGANVISPWSGACPCVVSGDQRAHSHVPCRLVREARVDAARVSVSRHLSPTRGRARLMSAFGGTVSLRFMMCLVLTTATGLLGAISAASLTAASAVSFEVERAATHQ